MENQEIANATLIRKFIRNILQKETYRICMSNSETTFPMAKIDNINELSKFCSNCVIIIQVFDNEWEIGTFTIYTNNQESKKVYISFSEDM
jgi:hypothetical protein